MLSRTIACLLVGSLIQASAAPGLIAASRTEQFQGLDVLLPDGNKANPEEALVRFEEHAMVLRGRESGQDFKTFKYSDVKTGEYAFSKSPRWKTGIGVAVAVGVFALPVFFMKGKKHWFTVRTNDDYAVMRLDKSNYRLVLAAFETRTGVKVESLGEDR